MEREKLLIIIPVYNESSSIENLVAEIKSSRMNIDYDILIIDDCSTDESLTIIKSLSCNYISLPTNIGIGGTMQTGYKYALRNNYAYTLQIDGDGQHPAKEINKILEEMRKGNADIIIGSRYKTKIGFQSTYLRRLGTMTLSFIIMILVKIIIKDVTSGFRMFNAKAIKMAVKYYPDEYPEPEFVIASVCHNLKISEVPVEMRERQGGESSIRYFNTLYYIFKVSLALVYTFLRFQNNIKNE